MPETRPLNAEEIFTDREYLSFQADQTERLLAEGFHPAVDPDVAEFMGAIEETALYPSEALASVHDVDENGVVIIGDEYQEAEQ